MLLPYFNFYAPDQGYYITQPATVGQLNRLRAYVDYMRKTINGYLDTIEGNADYLQRLDDRITAAENVLQEYDKHLKTLDTTLAALSKNVEEITSEYHALVARGVVHEIQVTPLPDGSRLTAVGNIKSAQHDIRYQSDGTIPLTVEQGDHATIVHMTTKGGTADPTALHLGQDNGDLALMLGRSILSRMAIQSPDDYIAATVKDGPILSLSKGKALATWEDTVADLIQETQDSVKREQARGEVKAHLTAVERRDNGVAVTFTILTQSADGTVVGRYPATITLDSDRTATISPTESGAAITVRDQIQDIPSVLTDIGLDSEADGSIVLTATGWDTKAKRPIDPKRSGLVKLTGDDTIAIKATADTISISGEPGLDAAKSYSNTQFKTLTHRIEEQTKRIDSLVDEVATLQSQVAEYKSIADKAVTAATMTLSEPDNDDERALVQTLQLSSKDGTIVAQLPIELRFVSQKSTIDTGVQLSGNTATIGLDTHT